MTAPARPSAAPDPAVAEVPVCRVGGPAAGWGADALAVEEPLEIRLGRRTVCVTMRTPGHDAELAVGYLFAEGVVTRREQVAGVHACRRAANVVRVEPAAGFAPDLSRLERHSYAASGCGVCGKTSLDAVRVSVPPVAAGPAVGAAVIHGLPGALRAAQPGFDRTGGLHAAALFDAGGQLLAVREDVGRHNALDKLIGAEFLAGRVPLAGCVVLVSGRASFELVQKAAAAGVPVLAAVGAPSSLAAGLAGECGMTLIGFARADRFNVYAGAERVVV